MFDNTAHGLRDAFERTRAAVAALGDGVRLPDVQLASEHFLDDVVFERLVGDAALPYPALTDKGRASGRRSALVEFPTSRFPSRITHRIFDMMRKRIRPVIAHPERYEPVWDDPSVLDPLLDAGAVLQLDVAALTGRYGRTPKRAAEALLSEGYYHAAASDAHSLNDVEHVKRGIEILFATAGKEEAEFLLVEGPRQILEGAVVT